MNHSKRPFMSFLLILLFIIPLVPPKRFMKNPVLHIDSGTTALPKEEIAAAVIIWMSPFGVVIDSGQVQCLLIQ
jgi:hypothetical protein